MFLIISLISRVVPALETLVLLQHSEFLAYEAFFVEYFEYFVRPVG